MLLNENGNISHSISVCVIISLSLIELQINNKLANQRYRLTSYSIAYRPPEDENFISFLKITRRPTTQRQK